jgi:hypothetical protein
MVVVVVVIIIAVGCCGRGGSGSRGRLSNTGWAVLWSMLVLKVSSYWHFSSPYPVVAVRLADTRNRLGERVGVGVLLSRRLEFSRRRRSGGLCEAFGAVPGKLLVFNP